MSLSKYLPTDAKHVLDNQAYRLAWEKINTKLDRLMANVDPTDKDAAQRVVIAKQIQWGLKRELEKIMETPEKPVKLKEVKKERIFRR